MVLLATFKFHHFLINAFVQVRSDEAENATECVAAYAGVPRLALLIDCSVEVPMVSTSKPKKEPELKAQVELKGEEEAL